MLFHLAFALIVCTTVFTFLLSVLSWRQRESVAGFYLFIWMMCASVWSLGTAICMVAYDIPWLWETMHRVRFTSISVNPVIMLCFALEHTNRRHWIHGGTWFLMVSIPLVTQVFNYTSLREHFVHPMTDMLGEAYLTVSIEPGPWFHVHAAHGILLSLAAGALLLNHIITSRGFYRRQTSLMFVGYMLPLCAAIMDAYTPEGWPLLDYTAIVFPFTAGFWYVALFKYRLFELTPVAHERLIEIMDDALFVFNDRQQVIDVNPAALTMTSFEGRDELLGTPFRELMAHDVLEGMIGGSSASSEVSIVTSEGVRAFEAKYIALERQKNERGSLGGMLVLIDITRRVQLIEELDAYAHTVAHDLKNPLNGLKNYLEMVEEELEDSPEESFLSEDGRHSLTSAHAISEKMTEIVDELLLMASMRRGDEVGLHELDMHDVLGAVVERLGVILTDVELVRPDEWPAALGYAPWVEEIWANYISNAVKYGGSAPVVELGAEDLGDGTVRFFVKDNGVGLTDEERQRLFSKFERLEQHSGIEGHGLGLSIVQRVADRLGGQVGVESAPGEGATFWFTLSSTTTREPDSVPHS